MRAATTISLKVQIGFIVLLSALVSISVGTVYFWGNSQQRQAETSLFDALHVKDAAEEAQFFLMDAHKLEKDVLFSRSLDADNAILQHQENAKTAVLRLKEIVPLMERDEDRNLVQKTISAITAYKEQFKKSADVQVLVGTNENDGLQGKLRKSVHTAEDTLATHNLDRLTILMLLMRRHEKDFLARLESKYVTEHDKRGDEFDAALANSDLAPADKAVLAQDIKAYRGDFKQMADSSLALLTEVKKLQQDYDLLTPDLQALRNLATAQADHAKSRSTEISRHVGQIITLALMAGTLLIVVLGTLITLIISRPLAQTTRLMTKLSEGDLKAAVADHSSVAEINQMLHAIQVFKDNALAMEEIRTNQAVKDKQGAERRLADRMKMADDLENKVGKIIGTVVSAASQLDSSARNMTAVSEETVSKVSSVSLSVQEAAANVETVAAASEELSASSQVIASHVNHANTIAENAAVEAAKTDEQVRGLVDAASKISDVVDLINDIASQTNLLALNATIEAARAGDAGKGFAVVANEVKHLANQTARATEEIAEQIQNVQQRTNNAVSAIKSISDTIAKMNEVSTAIMIAVNQQSDATLEIARNIQGAHVGTRDAADNVQVVRDGAQESSQAAEEVTTAADELNSQAVALRRVVENFLASFRLGGSSVLQWGENWITGNTVIDQDHKRLVELVNELNQSVADNNSRESTGDVLRGLMDYTHEHFGREEKIWLENGLQSFDAHQKTHQDLIKQVVDFEHSYRINNAAITDELMNFLRSWLIDHVFLTDKAALAQIEKNRKAQAA